MTPRPFCEKTSNDAKIFNTEKYLPYTQRIQLGRGSKTRTCGLYVPNVARYQLRHTPYSKIDRKNTVFFSFAKKNFIFFLFFFEIKKKY